MPKSDKNFGTLKPIGFELIKIYQVLSRCTKLLSQDTPAIALLKAIGYKIDQQGKRKS